MDFLDPKKQRRHKMILITGYFLIACVVAGLTYILLFEAYGFGLKNGAIVQYGLVYLSSQPNPANITINGQPLASTTDTSLTEPEGIYHFTLTRSGYRTWSQTIEIQGGMIESYTYPLLIPDKLITDTVKSYSSAPALATESLNRHWLLISQPGSDNFDLYNLTNPALAPTTITLPAGVLSAATNSESWQLVGWANDNSHVLLNHIYDGKSEYIMLDVANPSQSINLSKLLGSVAFTSISLNNERYNQYYLYNQTNNTLMTDSLSTASAPTVVLSNVLAFDGYNGNTILYATPDASPGKVDIDEMVGSTNYRIKTLDSGTGYLLNMASYNGTVYVAGGVTNQNKVYVWKNPVGQLQADPKQVPVPAQVLFVNNPTTVTFSNSTQFVAAESGNHFAVFNIENASGYNYTTNLTLDAPQANASWIDGDRMSYVSGGKLIIYEYDNNYQQTLVNADAQYLPFFTPSYNYFYTLAPGPNGSTILTRTSLYTPADQPQKLS